MTLSVEQQQALDELFALVPQMERRPNEPDLLQTWLGISGDELHGKLQALLKAKDRLEHQVLDAVERNPLDLAMAFLSSASAAFYAAEKGVNPKIETYTDAFYYIATCASVGYADIFAVTQAGRAIAALVMIVGPALTSRALDRPLHAER
jgi:Ion channel